MTVGDLKELLENYDDDTGICIGMLQTYGNNFAMKVLEVEEYEVNNWDNPYEKEEYLVFVEGRQFGTVKE